MLMELLSKAATVAMLSFVVSSMLAMGAGLTVSQIAEPLRNVRLVVLALLANFVVMPLGALALTKVLWLDEPFGIGLLLLGCAAGAPFLPKLAELAKGNLAFAVGAMVLLMVATVAYQPASYETVRRWFLKFGPSIAANIRRSRPRPSDHWHLDEMSISIRGGKYWLWRAVDNEGEVLDFLVQGRRGAPAGTPTT